MVRFARGKCEQLLVQDRNERVVVIAGIPFGSSGQTNNIRIVELGQNGPA